MPFLPLGFALSTSALAAPDLAGIWRAVSPAVAELSAVPVPFDPEDRESLADVTASVPIGQRYDTPSGSYATGAVWVDAPIESVWIVIQDAPHDPPSRVTTTRLPAPAGVRRVYMTLDLPYPLADRQWVADVTTNTRVHTATGGTVWQRQWTLADPALAPAPDPKAAWVGESKGAWTLVDTGNGTLVLFTVRTVLGGVIPASIAQGWAVGTLKSTMARVIERSRAIPEHYVGDHEVIVTPTGDPIVRGGAGASTAAP